MMSDPKSPTAADLLRDDDAGIAQLLREVGARDEPTSAMADEVRFKVHQEWQAVVDARRRQRRFVGYGMAASLLGAIAVTFIAWRVTVLPVVTIARLQGTADIVVDGQRRPIIVGQEIASGDVLATKPDAKLALDFGDGVTARVDGNSELKMVDNRDLQLNRGAIYVDAVPGSKSRNELVLMTHLGSVRHVGTQYQVRIVDSGVEVSVREGSVEIRSDRGTNAGVAGERLVLSGNGDITRDELPPYDANWQWTAAIAPVFDIGNKSLYEFLTWTARETGRELLFDNAQAQQAATAVKLRGSIEGLDLDTALVAVLSTTKLRRIKANDDSIRIALSGD